MLRLGLPLSVLPRALFDASGGWLLPQWLDSRAPPPE